MCLRRYKNKKELRAENGTRTYWRMRSVGSRLRCAEHVQRTSEDRNKQSLEKHTLGGRMTKIKIETM